MTRTAGPDVVVVGGGIVGTSAAAFLAARGASVVLVEAEGLASGASGANSGVVQHPFDPVLAALYRETVDHYRDLAARSNAFPFAPRPAGMLYISPSAGAVRRQASLIDAAFPMLGTEVIGGDELRRLEPAVGPALWACRVDIGYPVMPGASTYAYATLAEAQGAVIRLGRGVTGLDTVGDRTVGVRIGDQRLAAGAVLIAAGPWSPGLIDPAGRWTPVQARWGVVVEAELAAPPACVLEEAGIEAVLDVMPAAGAGDQPGGREAYPGAAEGDPGPADGLSVVSADADGVEGADSIEFSLVPLPGASAVGSTFLPREPDPARWIEPILTRAAQFVPAVADAPIRGVRACARPQSVDGRPLIGAVPGRPGLFVCAGHGPWGISTGPASARLVADLILDGVADVAPELDPARFGTPGSAAVPARP
jgi:sarcosine oxidase subunit beta